MKKWKSVVSASLATAMIVTSPSVSSLPVLNNMMSNVAVVSADEPYTSSTTTIDGYSYTLFTYTGSTQNTAVLNGVADGATLPIENGKLVINTAVTASDSQEYIVNIIGANAFNAKTDIKELEIQLDGTNYGSTLTINAGAFKGLTNLTKVSIVSADADTTGQGVIIQDGAFEGCTALTELDITSENTVTVATNAFKGCSALNKVVLNSVKYENLRINKNSFPNAATEIYVPFDQDVVNKITDAEYANYKIADEFTINKKANVQDETSPYNAKALPLPADLSATGTDDATVAKKVAAKDYFNGILGRQIDITFEGATDAQRGVLQNIDNFDFQWCSDEAGATALATAPKDAGEYYLKISFKDAAHFPNATAEPIIVKVVIDKAEYVATAANVSSVKYGVTPSPSITLKGVKTKEAVNDKPAEYETITDPIVNYFYTRQKIVGDYNVKGTVTVPENTAKIDNNNIVKQLPDNTYYAYAEVTGSGNYAAATYYVGDFVISKLDGVENHYKSGADAPYVNNITYGEKLKKGVNYGYGEAEYFTDNGSSDLKEWFKIKKKGATPDADVANSLGTNEESAPVDAGDYRMDVHTPANETIGYLEAKASVYFKINKATLVENTDVKISDIKTTGDYEYGETIKLTVALPTTINDKGKWKDEASKLKVTYALSKADAKPTDEPLKEGVWDSFNGTKISESVTLYNDVNKLAVGDYKLTVTVDDKEDAGTTEAKDNFNTFIKEINFTVKQKSNSIDASKIVADDWYYGGFEVDGKNSIRNIKESLSVDEGEYTVGVYAVPESTDIAQYMNAEAQADPEATEKKIDETAKNYGEILYTDATEILHANQNLAASKEATLANLPANAENEKYILVVRSAKTDNIAASIAVKEFHVKKSFTGYKLTLKNALADTDGNYTVPYKASGWEAMLETDSSIDSKTVGTAPNKDKLLSSIVYKLGDTVLESGKLPTDVAEGVYTVSVEYKDESLKTNYEPISGFTVKIVKNNVDNKITISNANTVRNTVKVDEEGRDIYTDGTSEYYIAKDTENKDHLYNAAGESVYTANGGRWIDDSTKKPVKEGTIDFVYIPNAYTIASEDKKTWKPTIANVDLRQGTTFKYYKDSVADENLLLTETPPSKPGTYVVVAVYNETAAKSYEAVAPITVTIERGTAEMTNIKYKVCRAADSGHDAIADKNKIVYDGTEYEVIITEACDSQLAPEDITIEYYKDGSTTPLTKKPSEAGTYKLHLIADDYAVYGDDTDEDISFKIKAVDNAIELGFSADAKNVRQDPEQPQHKFVRNNTTQYVDLYEWDCGTYDATKDIPTVSAKYGESRLTYGISANCDTPLAADGVYEKEKTFNSLEALSAELATLPVGYYDVTAYIAKDEGGNYTESSKTIVVKVELAKNGWVKKNVGTPEEVEQKPAIRKVEISDGLYQPWFDYDPSIKTRDAYLKNIGLMKEDGTYNFEAKYGTETAVVKYKVKDSEDKYVELTDNSLPSNAGEYSLVVTIPGTDKYKEIQEGVLTFKVLPVDDAYLVDGVEVTDKIADVDLKFGQTFASLPKITAKSGNAINMVVTNPNGEVVDSFSEEGIYTATVSVAKDANGNYNEMDAMKFRVNVTESADLAFKETPVVTGWTYGESVARPEVKATVIGVGGKEVDAVLTYAYSDTADGTFTSAVPTSAGTHYIKVTATADNYSDATQVVSFEIAKAAPAPTVSLDGWTYGEKANEPKVDMGGSDATASTVVYYDAKGNKLSAVPTNAGNYKVAVEVAEGTNYKAATSPLVSFSIAKAQGQISVDEMTGWTYGEKANEPKVTTTASKYDVTYVKSNGYAVDGVPTEAGDYRVVATTNDDNYIQTEASKDFTIAKKNDALEISIENWAYNDDAKAPVVTNSESKLPTTVTYVTYDENAADKKGKALQGAPKVAGHYWVKVATAGNTNYNPVEAWAEFDIYEAEDSIKISIANWTYGQKASTPVVTVASSKKATVSYRNSKGEDLGSTVPTEAGIYLLVATTEDGDNYKGTTATQQFTINPADNSFTKQLSISGWEEGKEAGTPSCEAAFGTDTIKYTYSDSETGTYTETAPQKVGTYYVKATVPASTNYKELVSDPVKFEITASKNGFKDVDGNSWQNTPVSYVYNRGLMTGYSSESFGPDDKLTREAVVQILYAVAGKPSVKMTDKFVDVKADDWFASSVSWAVENKISSGYGNQKFGIGDSILRQDMALMIYKYVTTVNPDFADKVNDDALDKFKDKDSIASYAQTAVKWCVTNGLLSGKGDNIDPTATATRAECAAVIRTMCLQFGL